MEDEIFEITTYRIEGEYKDHRRPDKVDFTDRLEEDLKRRDFTINAMAYNEQEGLVDLFKGKLDISLKATERLVKSLIAKECKYIGIDIVRACMGGKLIL